MPTKGLAVSKAKEAEAVVILTGIVEKEDAQYVSYCPQLGTSSCGDTVDEAVKNLGDAIEVHIKGLIETGELLDFLRERNIRIDLDAVSLQDVDVRVTVRPGAIFTTYKCPVPMPPRELVTVS